MLALRQHRQCCRQQPLPEKRMRKGASLDTLMAPMCWSYCNSTHWSSGGWGLSLCANGTGPSLDTVTTQGGFFSADSCVFLASALGAGSLAVPHNFLSQAPGFASLEQRDGGPATPPMLINDRDFSLSVFLFKYGCAVSLGPRGHPWITSLESLSTSY